MAASLDSGLRYEVHEGYCICNNNYMNSAMFSEQKIVYMHR